MRSSPTAIAIAAGDVPKAFAAFTFAACAVRPARAQRFRRWGARGGSRRRHLAQDRGGGCPSDLTHPTTHRWGSCGGLLLARFGSGRTQSARSPTHRHRPCTSSGSPHYLLPGSPRTGEQRSTASCCCSTRPLLPAVWPNCRRLRFSLSTPSMRRRRQCGVSATASGRRSKQESPSGSGCRYNRSPSGYGPAAQARRGRRRPP